jgi:hypothetical protein
MQLQAPHCPGCGAPIEVKVNALRATCKFCAALLIVEGARISTHDEAPKESRDEVQVFREPDATLWTSETSHFEMSMIEQNIPAEAQEEFVALELRDGRFAFVLLRTIDREGVPLKTNLTHAQEALLRSLEEDADPGLAANAALEALCTPPQNSARHETLEQPFHGLLECGIALFEPRRMRVLSYSAGLRDGMVWASSEEGRSICLSNSYRNALERKNLRESADLFSNHEPRFLAAGDLVLIPSAGFAGRAPGASLDGLRALYDTANNHLGEAPLRLVTLAKNEFWKSFRERRSSEPPAGDVRLAAIRAVPPPLQTRREDQANVQVFQSKRYEISALLQPDTQSRWLDLHSERNVLVLVAGVESSEFDGVCASVLDVLNGDSGDNDNPRQAAREALASFKKPPRALAVVQVFDAFSRVKYFRLGWKQPLYLGARHERGGHQQQFDEGGEATVETGARLWFPGALKYEGQAGDPEQLSRVWPRGKSSRTYEALRHHWKTKKTPVLLEKLSLAVISDELSTQFDGFILLSCLE